MAPQDSTARALQATSESVDQSSAVTALPSFEVIYEKHFDFVWSMTLRLGVSGAATDDVVQEIFMIVHGRLSTLRQPASLRSWIYGIVRRTVSDYRRSQRSRAAFGATLAVEAEVRPSSPQTPLDVTEQHDRVKVLHSLLEELDPLKREVFVLAELEELSVPEIAEALEIPLNTAYSRLRLAREAFEQRLARRALREPQGLKRA
ncbi:MAG TPA: sigma-70 family RNA polymerase sigma factor [Polyangiaceae bacterium]|nr:sigma-70 family RNA polymerase sigma factor [Polyangiaceae bacterium]